MIVLQATSIVSASGQCLAAWAVNSARAKLTQREHSAVLINWELSLRVCLIGSFQISLLTTAATFAGHFDFNFDTIRLAFFGTRLKRKRLTKKLLALSRLLEMRKDEDQTEANVPCKVCVCVCLFGIEVTMLRVIVRLWNRPFSVSNTAKPWNRAGKLLSRSNSGASVHGLCRIVFGRSIEPVIKVAVKLRTKATDNKGHCVYRLHSNVCYLKHTNRMIVIFWHIITWCTQRMFLLFCNKCLFGSSWNLA